MRKSATSKSNESGTTAVILALSLLAILVLIGAASGSNQYFDVRWTDQLPDTFPKIIQNAMGLRLAR